MKCSGLSTEARPPGRFVRGWPRDDFRQNSTWHRCLGIAGQATCRELRVLGPRARRRACWPGSSVRLPGSGGKTTSGRSRPPLRTAENTARHDCQVLKAARNSGAVRIRAAGEADRHFGFGTRVVGVAFAGLDPDTGLKLKPRVRAGTATGEALPRAPAGQEAAQARYELFGKCRNSPGRTLLLPC